MADSTGPAELVLWATVARRYYLDGESKVDIAEALGISRFRVARMLEAARESGMVRIEIVRHGSLDVDASAQLRERYHLEHAVVIEHNEAEPTAVRQQLGTAAAELLREVLQPGDVLGLPWSRNVHAMVSALTHLPPVEVVQLTGAITLPDLDSSTVDIVRRASRVAGGTATVFYAPFVMDSEASADTLRRQPAVAEGLARAAAVTKAVVGIGRWAPGESTIHDLLSPDEQADLAARGVLGELAGVFFDENGKTLRPKVAARLITLDPEALARIDDVIAMAWGASKAPAVRAALNGGLVHGLVTDAALAHALLTS